MSSPELGTGGVGMICRLCDDDLSTDGRNRICIFGRNRNLSTLLAEVTDTPEEDLYTFGSRYICKRCYREVEKFVSVRQKFQSLKACLVSKQQLQLKHLKKPYKSAISKAGSGNADLIPTIDSVNSLSPGSASSVSALEGLAAFSSNTMRTSIADVFPHPMTKKALTPDSTTGKPASHLGTVRKHEDGNSVGENSPFAKMSEEKDRPQPEHLSVVENRGGSTARQRIAEMRTDDLLTKQAGRENAYKVIASEVSLLSAQTLTNATPVLLPGGTGKNAAVTLPQRSPADISIPPQCIVKSATSATKNAVDAATSQPSQTIKNRPIQPQPQILYPTVLPQPPPQPNVQLITEQVPRAVVSDELVQVIRSVAREEFSRVKHSMWKGLLPEGLMSRVQTLELEITTLEEIAAQLKLRLEKEKVNVNPQVDASTPALGISNRTMVLAPDAPTSYSFGSVTQAHAMDAKVSATPIGSFLGDIGKNPSKNPARRSASEVLNNIAARLTKVQHDSVVSQESAITASPTAPSSTLPNNPYVVNAPRRFLLHETEGVTDFAHAQSTQAQIHGPEAGEGLHNQTASTTGGVGKRPLHLKKIPNQEHSSVFQDAQITVEPHYPDTDTSQASTAEGNGMVSSSRKRPSSYFYEHPSLHPHLEVQVKEEPPPSPSSPVLDHNANDNSHPNFHTSQNPRPTKILKSVSPRRDNIAETSQEVESPDLVIESEVVDDMNTSTNSIAPLQVFSLQVPTKPSLTVSTNPSGIAVSWSMDQTDSTRATVKSYKLFVWQENKKVRDSSPLWREVGSVDALPLPMACTLTQFVAGFTYHFIVYAVDVYGRTGESSDPATITLE